MRRSIDATGWTEIGLMDANWDRFLKFRLDPAFFSTDLGILINIQKWNALSPKAKEILTKVAAEHEVSSMKTLADLRTKEFAELAKRHPNASAPIRQALSRERAAAGCG